MQITNQYKVAFGRLFGLSHHLSILLGIGNGICGSSAIAGTSKIINAKDEEIGIITSGTMSPTLKKSIAMAYVLTDYSAIDQEVFVQIRNKKIKAKIVEIPFVK